MNKEYQKNYLKSNMEDTLLTQYQLNPSAELRGEIIKKYLPYIKENVSRYYNYRDQHLINDLTQEGVLGLIDALNVYKFNGNFRGCLSWWIKKRCFEYVRVNQDVKIPASLTKKVKQIKDFEDKFSEENGRFPTRNEVFDKIPATSPAYYYSNAHRVSPQEANISEDHNISSDYKPEMQNQILQIFDSLKSEESYVLKERYGFNGEPKTLQEVSVKMGVSYERVRQIQKKAETKLKKRLR